MPEAERLEKATLQEIRWDRGGHAESVDAQGAETRPFPVQFNPQSLKVNYSNQKAGGDQPQGSPVQFVGKGATKLTLELWFDTTARETSGGEPRDVRVEVEKVNAFMRPKPAGGRNPNAYVPPGVRFQWGAFLFEGVMDSMDETVEFFSGTGVPLRASVSIALSKQEIQFNRRPVGAAPPGTSPHDQARSGDTVQQMAARAGNPDWKGVALANGIENPRRLAPGTLVDTSAGGRAAPSLGGGPELPGAAALGSAIKPGGGGLGFVPPGVGGAGPGLGVSLASPGAAGLAGLSPGAGGGLSGGAGGGFSAGATGGGGAGAEVR